VLPGVTGDWFLVQQCPFVLQKHENPSEFPPISGM